MRSKRYTPNPRPNAFWFPQSSTGLVWWYSFWIYTAQIQVAELSAAISANVATARTFLSLCQGRSTSDPLNHVASVPTTADMKLPSARERTVKYVAKYVPGYAWIQPKYQKSGVSSRIDLLLSSRHISRPS